jgi:hypothetical protein
MAKTIYKVFSAKFNESTLRSPPPGPAEFRDRDHPQLALRILKGGGCYFYCVGHIRSRGSTRLSIGDARKVLLVDARERAAAMLSKMAMGEMPVTAVAAQRDEARQIREAELAAEAERKAAEAERMRRRQTSFRTVATAYFVALRKRDVRSAGDVEREIGRLCAAWDDRPSTRLPAAT